MPTPNGFPNINTSPCLASEFFFDSIGMNQTHHHQTINRLYTINGVTARNRNTCLLTNRLTALQYFCNDVGTQNIDGHPHNRQGHDGCTAHCINIADRISCCNAPKVKWIVNSCGGKANAELFFSISLRTPGAILQPHPPPCEREVSRVGDIGVFMNSNWIVTVNFQL